MLTQYNDKELREAARLAGASDYVCKENLIEARRILSDYQKAQGVSAEK
jgi:CheY-like chemotaxis protein